MSDIITSMRENQTVATRANVKAFLEKVIPEKKKEDCFEILKIMEKVTGEKAVMWGPAIVGFGSHHYKYPSGREGDMCLTGFSPRKQNITLYVLSGFEEREDFIKKLGKCKASKGCIYINTLNDIDIKVLEQIIKKSVDHIKKHGTFHEEK